MLNPIVAHKNIQDAILKYIGTAFGTASETFEQERAENVLQEGVVFREQYIEPMPEYSKGKTLAQLNAGDLPGLSQQSIDVFKSLCGAKLFPSQYNLFEHQQNMLRESLAGKHCVVTTGTGSGKTEAFLLPLIASIIKEASGWSPTNQNQRTQPFWANTLADWKADRNVWRNNKRIDHWGQTRDSALRSIILYPMNALVEDQLSRLREAMDFDEAHTAYHNNEQFFNGNRITFGRFNGDTPVSGHPFRPDGKANSSKRSKLKDALWERKQTFDQLCQKLGAARSAGDLAAEKEILELMTFFSRVDDQSTEMLHRWEMQRTPPDILITNFSMLSIMLMRHANRNQIAPDQADCDIFDKTRTWLEGDACRQDNSIKPTRVFHLVVDELHLYRGTAGTEVAYLIRLLLDRLGLNPTSPQLRILASSASLETTTAKQDETFQYLGQFFGIGDQSDNWQETKNRFEVIGGKKIGSQDPNVNPILPNSVIKKCEDLVEGEDADSEIANDLSAVEGIVDKLREACRKGKSGELATVPISAFCEKLFGTNATLKTKTNLFGALQKLPSVIGNASVPRFRLHWMIRNIDGVWSSLDRATARITATSDPWRVVGKLYHEAGRCVDENGNRVLENVYCDCCGTIFVAGYRSLLPGLPGQPVAQELLPVSPDLEKLPRGYSDSLTGNETYSRLAVFWPSMSDEVNQPQGLTEFRQAKIAALQNKDGKGFLIKSDNSESAAAKWQEAYLNPRNAVVSFTPQSESDVHGYLFVVDGLGNREDCPAMPHVCPNCSADYSQRIGRLSPVRSFRTGINKYIPVAFETSFSRLR